MARNEARRSGFCRPPPSPTARPTSSCGFHPTREGVSPARPSTGPWRPCTRQRLEGWNKDGVRVISLRERTLTPAFAFLFLLRGWRPPEPVRGRAVGLGGGVERHGWRETRPAGAAFAVPHPAPPPGPLPAAAFTPPARESHPLDLRQVHGGHGRAAVGGGRRDRVRVLSLRERTLTPTFAFLFLLRGWRPSEPVRGRAVGLGGGVERHGWRETRPAGAAFAVPHPAPPPGAPASA
ncbi:hypothetical protein QE373_001136 [Stenotrophomonas sp. SORGH_AS321]|nr:hypothetical protein [Stenotrophomonas sp. SORGH_AS_0321]